jgi:hypothetical protein
MPIVWLVDGSDRTQRACVSGVAWVHSSFWRSIFVRFKSAVG